MIYHVSFTEGVKRDFKKLDRHIQIMLMTWIEKHLEGTTNPRQYGKALTHDRIGQWRYRVGDYRIITYIEDDKLIILVIAAGHRREIYS